MSDPIREQLSALMDGELARDQLRFLLRRLDAEPELADTWSRYQLASSILRRQGALPRADIAGAVLSRLRADGRATRRRRALALARWLGGGAIAAAVAVFALVATTPPTRENPSLGGLAGTPSSIANSGATAAHAAFPPLLLNPDLAQPASLETPLYPIPRYDLRYREESSWVDPQRALIPYLLVRMPARTPPNQTPPPAAVQR
jgi:sigma-E factor negative regulatory protein RseA